MQRLLPLQASLQQEQLSESFSFNSSPFPATKIALFIYNYTVAHSINQETILLINTTILLFCPNFAKNLPLLLLILPNKCIIVNVFFDIFLKI
jgi:hypothetical protein